MSGNQNFNLARAKYDSGVDRSSSDEEDDSDDDLMGASLTSTILQPIWGNGRQYHSFLDSIYFLATKTNLGHHIYSRTLKEEPPYVPCKDERCLDVGTGTGQSAIEIADTNKDAIVTAIDISPTQPTRVPKNLSFLIDNAERTWNYVEKFGFIFCRGMDGSFEDWPRFFSRAYDNLDPGGRLDCQDLDFFCNYKNAPHFAKLWDLILQAYSQNGTPMRETSKHKERMEAAGFVVTRDDVFLVYVNKASKKYKKLLLQYWEVSLASLALRALTRILMWTRKDVEDLYRKAMGEVGNQKANAHLRITFFSGMKSVGKTK